MGRSPEARSLARLLCELPDEDRRAILALAINEALQLGVLKAGLQFWPHDLPPPQSAERDRAAQ